MTKTELMENYTAEQLADKYLRLQERFNRYTEVIKGIVDEFPEELKQGTEFHLEIDRLQSEAEKYRKAFEGAKKERDFQIAEYRNRTEKDREGLERAKNTITRIDEILRELFGVTFEICETKEDFDGFKKCLKKNIKEAYVSDFIPIEPIKVADMLINAEGEYEHNPITKAFCGTDKGAYRIFEVSELKQIAEHLLVYCNHNVEAEEC